jgi:hypothetical protein
MAAGEGGCVEAFIRIHSSIGHMMVSAAGEVEGWERFVEGVNSE